jgi:hypothetical protein
MNPRVDDEAANRELSEKVITFHACIFTPQTYFSEILAVMSWNHLIEYKVSSGMSQHSPDHMKMMTIKKHLKNCTKKLNTVLKRNAQLLALGEKVEVSLADTGMVAKEMKSLLSHLDCF